MYRTKSKWAAAAQIIARIPQRIKIFIVSTSKTRKSRVARTTALNFHSGRGRRTWTLSLRFWRPLLYQLSYTPMGRLVGIEPTHIGATIRRVNHFTRAAIFQIKPWIFPDPRLEAFSGEYLISQGVTTQVPSAYECLTAVFGMGTGGTTQPSSPETFELFQKSKERLSSLKIAQEKQHIRLLV